MNLVEWFVDNLISYFKVFHEGLKSYSCCSDKNKPVLDFDEFMRIPVRQTVQTVDGVYPDLDKSL